MQMQGWILSGVVLATMVAGGAEAQGFPTKPVRIVTGSAGSNSDFVARVTSQALTVVFNQQVIIENRPSGVILGEIVANAQADGYTLLVTGSSFWLQPFLTPKLPWDPIRDFTPVSLLASVPNLVVVHPALGIKSVQELIAFAKAKPGVLNYASGSTGSTPHLGAELFKSMAGVNITRINYKGSAGAINDLVAGQVPVMFPTVSSVISHVQSGKIRALAVTSAQPTDLAPGLPTVAASGVPGYEFVSLTGMFAPAKLPKALLARLNQETLDVLKNPEVRKRFFTSGAEVVGSTPERFGTVVKEEIKRLGKVIQDAGIQNE
jgi:tripartite-type tricarboxylate transporter receptor subunit TctC